MKRILLFTMLFVVIACNKNTKEDEEPVDCCCTPPTYFSLFVNTSSAEYQNFLDSKGEVDKQNVYFYQLLENRTERKIDTYLISDDSEKKGYMHILINSPSFLYTGKTEIFYLKNKTKTYKIEFLGTIGKCCIGKIKEMYIDGVKNDNFILVK